LELTDPLIVPPTLNKKVRELPGLRKLWALAAYALERAEHIIVWGYSLPPTDFFSEWLLRQGGRVPCRRLTIINPEVLTPELRLNQGFIRRFLEALEKPEQTLDLKLFQSFQDMDSGRDIFALYNHLPRDDTPFTVRCLSSRLQPVQS
jgi:hypothetical protein